MIKFDIDELNHNQSFASFSMKPKITIIGVGGAGGNMLQAVCDANMAHVSLVALNTDFQALETLHVPKKVVLGASLTSGMGTGANPEVGKIAVEENIDEIVNIVSDSDIVFLLGGLGGGTGSGVLPVIARILQEKQILSIALITKPFFFEGARRMQVAQSALQKIEEIVDTHIVIPNQKLFDTADLEHVSLVDAFAKINTVVVDCIKAVTETIFFPGHINVDFADIKTTMTRMGKAVIGVGKGRGEKRACDAIQAALACPLLEHNSLKGARSILLNIQGNSSLSLHEMNLIATYVHDEVHPDAHIIVGNSLQKNQEDDTVTLTIIATGFEDQLKSRLQNKNTAHYVPQGYFSQGVPPQQYQKSMNAPYHHGQQMNEKQAGEGQQRFQETTPKNLDIPTFFRNQHVAEK
jgi:cell division protein FtsZ